MRIMLIIFVLLGATHAARVHEVKWPSKFSFAEYLRENNATSVLRTMSAEDSKYVAEVRSEVKIYELRDHGLLLKALIPLGEEMQIELVRRPDTSYSFDIIPIIYRKINDKVSFRINQGFRKQINQITGNTGLPFRVSKLFGNDEIFKKLQPRDHVAFSYTQKERMGHPWGSPKVNAALLNTHKHTYFSFVDKKGNVYHGTHKLVSYQKTEKRPFTYTKIRRIPSKNFRLPVNHPRITSRFTYRRWHPILHKYRPHFGVDFGAKRGTPIYAINGGKVTYAGWMRGYGKVTKINHGRGFVSLYGHQSKINVKVGQQVKKGQLIGKVGSTGRSTGPHLHLGLYHKNKPVDPFKYISRKGTGGVRVVREKHTVMKDYQVVKHKQVEIKNAKKIKGELEALIKHPTNNNYKWNTTTKNIIYVDEIIVDAKQNGKEGSNG